MKELEKLVYQALGEASMCWSQVPKGIFQSNKAVEIGEKLIKAIQALSQSEGESVIKEIERRLLIVKSEPNGIVRETMLDDLLINLTPPQTK